MGAVAPRYVGSSQTRARTRVPLHWQADSQPLRHQGSPGLVFGIACSRFGFCFTGPGGGGASDDCAKQWIYL